MSTSTTRLKSKRKASLQNSSQPALNETLRYIKRNKYYYILLVLPVIYFILFKYVPMFGNIIAFRKYKAGMSPWGVEWVGFRYFKMFLSDPSFLNAFKNSFILSVCNLLFTFPVPIIFALLLNELGNGRFKRFVQTSSYLPKFLSTVVVVGMIKEILSPSTGIVNALLNRAGMKQIFFLTEPEWFRIIYIVSDLWQFMGWNAIIYLASIASINIELYEAAMIDGANRLKQTFHVTIPGIMPTIVITLLLSIGYLLSLSFEKILLLYTPSTYEVSDVLETFVYRIGIQNNSYSYATAVGLFSGVIGLFLISSSNFLARKLTDTSLF